MKSLTEAARAALAEQQLGQVLLHLPLAALQDADLNEEIPARPQHPEKSAHALDGPTSSVAQSTWYSRHGPCDRT